MRQVKHQRPRKQWLFWVTPILCLPRRALTDMREAKNMNHTSMLDTVVDMDEFELDVKTADQSADLGNEPQMTSGIGCMCCPF
ncbi:hypothetical protein [Streptomyces sp. H27-C3]|uniref:hypothetical protein n=1 Tax=Streptomyces sp. H27-C3 TaxID=3046305 RepID=UPI0024BA08C2|nr:hypothetical protein [Streptomyces sp. H27-C3]MDJ0466234.1 hypothetical protein [Streptomyces sp. H27-C3]